MAVSIQQSPADGYPARHYEVLRRVKRAALTRFAVTGSLAAGLTWGALYGPVPVAVAAVAGAVFLLFGVFGGVLGVYDTVRYVRVIPYFDATVGEIDTFLSGDSLARCIQPLDRLAKELGVAPLSSFGFNDDLCGETLTWYPAERGLPSVDALLRALERKEDDVWAAVCDDLRKIRFALARAEEQGIQFCFLLWHGNSTSGHEWSVRKGHAF